MGWGEKGSVGQLPWDVLEQKMLCTCTVKTAHLPQSRLESSGSLIVPPLDTSIPASEHGWSFKDAVQMGRAQVTEGRLPRICALESS